MSTAAPTRCVRWLRTVGVIAAVVVAQTTLFDRLDPDGVVRVDLPLLLVTAIAMRVAFDDAALVGFVTGIAVDLFQVGPFGRHSLVYAILGFAVAVLTQRLRGLRSSSTARTWAGAGGGALERTVTRGVVAGTAAVVAGVGLLAVDAAAHLAPPTAAAIASGRPLAGLTGAVVGIHLVVPTIGALGVAGPSHRVALAGRSGLGRDSDAWAGPLPLARRP